jgi:DNA polymerase-4
MISWHLNCSVTPQTLCRRILHIDMDAFYASVESRDDPSLRGKPLAVGGSPHSRGVVMAASYEARAFGVRSAIPMARAVRLCPELVIVRPDFARYKAVSQQVMAILRSCTPLVEPLSLDEAYLDVTENLWGEPLATNVAKRIKERIREELGLTASAGVAPNKFLAKIASGWQKPDGLTVIAPERVEQFLQQLPVETLWGVGPVTAKKLRAVGIARLVDVRSADRELLSRTVGSLGVWLLRRSHGDDPRPVISDRPYKSISCEETYARDLSDFQEMASELERMSEQLAASLSRKRLRARTVTIKVRYADFTTVTRSHTAETASNSEKYIADCARTLLARTDAAHRPVRLLGVGAHGLEREGDGHPESERLF